MKTIKFGIIGCGLMGNEFISATMRWFHLPEMDVRPEVIAVCDTRPEITANLRKHCATIKNEYTDYKDLLANPEVEAVYIAVPHNLHAEIYCAAIDAGKHVMGEKPFGIDKPANDAIMEALERHPGQVVRCSSQSIFFPAVQRIGKMFESGAFGRIIQVESGFLHCSDLDPNKPINWKRILKYNGEYGCMGDLGMHVCHFPFRAGWYPKSVHAVLSKIVTERPDGKGGMYPCETWDNATMLCTADDADGHEFPLTFKTFRIAPGHKNSWYLEVYGTKGSARWTSQQANTIQYMDYTPGGEQPWQVLDMGHEMAFKSLTGVNFETGFSDIILQLWAAFVYEIAKGEPKSRFSGCATPEEVAASHALFTAALESHKTGTMVKL